MNISYHASPYPTIGVEVELQLLDAESGEFVSAAPVILEHFQNDVHFKAELIQSTLEINTGVCRTVRDIFHDLQLKFRRTKEFCDSQGLLPAIAGTHPFSMWGTQKITDNERYRRLVELVQWPARRLLIFGVHLHVGVSNGEKAVAVALNNYMPHLLALSASSPFWYGEETGLTSTRVKIFETLPTAGLPYQLSDWNEFQQFTSTLITAGAIESIREVWWDIRPHPGFGTVEMRICDGVPSLKEICALTALYQCLVVWLGNRYEEGDTVKAYPRWLIRENKWRASRWSMDADIIVNEKGETKKLSAEIVGLLESMNPLARELDCERELGWVEKLLLKVPSYIRQKKIYRETGSFPRVCDSLAEEFCTDL